MSKSWVNAPKMITIVIPVRNEENFVSRCLDSVLPQLSSLQECEILCVDGASTDCTRQIVLKYASKDSRVHLVENPSQIVPTALNEAIRQARGEVIIRLDCHAKYSPDYIGNCLDVLERTDADNVGGYIETIPEHDTPVSRAIAAATSSRFGVGDSVFRVGGEEKEVDTIPFGCFRKDVFERFGIFDERLVRNQDIELNSRIRAHGGKIVISPKIRATYYMRSTFAGLRQQAFNNGLWNPYTLYLTGGGMRLRHFVPLGFVLSLVALATLGIYWSPMWILLASVLVLYLLVGGTVAAIEARKSGTSWILILASFLQLHLAYGIGSLVGVVTSPFKFGLHPSKKAVGQPLRDRKY